MASQSMALAKESRILHSEMAMLLDVDVTVTERLVASGLSMIFFIVCDSMHTQLHIHLSGQIRD